MSLAREKMEADQQTTLLSKEVENVKVFDQLQFIFTAVVFNGKRQCLCNTGRVDGSDAGGSPGEGEGEGGYEGEGGGGQPAAAQDAGEVEGGGRMIPFHYSRKKNHMKCFCRS